MYLEIHDDGHRVINVGLTKHGHSFVSQENPRLLAEVLYRKRLKERNQLKFS